MGISVIEPVGLAMNHMFRLLFKPFQARTWFVLGFASFLATLGEGGGSGRFPTSLPGSGGSGSGGSGGSGASEFDSMFGDALGWINSNLDLVIGVGVAVVVGLVALSVGGTWLTSRGKFIFLDGVVRETAAIVEPWSRLRAEANSLFFFKVILGFGTFLWFLVSAGVGYLVWRASGATALPWLWGVLTFAGLFLPPLIPLAFASWLVDTFGVLWMYGNGGTGMAALRRVWKDVVVREAKSLILFVLLNLAMSMGAAVLAMMAVLFTCCIGALPYLSSVVLLPIAVFFRAYSLHFAAQLGPQWQLRRASKEELVDVFR